MSSGGGGDPSKDLAAQEAENRARRNAAIGKINSFFNGEPAHAEVKNPFTGEVLVPATADTHGLRDRLYRKIATDTTKFQTDDLNEQRRRNDRELTYQLARTGNLHSSTDISQRGELTRLYRRGALQAANIGQTAADQARGNDENARLQAIQSVNSDVDPAQALQAAQAQTRVNASQAADYGKGQSVGNVFNNLTYLYGQYQNGQQQRNAINYANQNGFGPQSSGAGRSNYGTVIP